ncbi:unnamed protein product, partial [Scytosiphon promiscuus]
GRANLAILSSTGSEETGNRIEVPVVCVETKLYAYKKAYEYCTASANTNTAFNAAQGKERQKPEWLKLKRDGRAQNVDTGAGVAWDKRDVGGPLNRKHGSHFDRRARDL